MEIRRRQSEIKVFREKLDHPQEFRERYSLALEELKTLCNVAETNIKVRFVSLQSGNRKSQDLEQAAEALNSFLKEVNWEDCLEKE